MVFDLAQDLIEATHESVLNLLQHLHRERDRSVEL